MNKFAFVLVGGICSGKSTFADKLEKTGDFFIVSKDKCIYESDMLCREHIFKSWEEVREEHINNLNGKNVILDETLRIGKLDKIKEKGYTIIAVLLEKDRTIREKRLLQRNALNKQYLLELSRIANIDFHLCSQEVRRNYWRDKHFRDSIPQKEQTQFDEILKKLYLLGSTFIKDEEPNPVCYNQIDYLINAEDIDVDNGVEISDIIKKCTSYHEYKKQWAKKIKFCIWDVGGVFYHYSLEKLSQWCSQKTIDYPKWESLKGTFSFNDYMLGIITFDELCVNICQYYSIPYLPEYNSQIKQCLEMGVGEVYSETEEAIKYLKKKGIVNCVLSNALPILADDGNYPELIDSEHRFYSFIFQRLKPDNDIYKMMQNKLNTPFENIIFIDDKKRNIDAAIELGIYSILYQQENIKDAIKEIFE